MAFTTFFMTALMAGVASAGVSAYSGSFAGAGGAASFAGPGGAYAGPGGAGTFGNFGPGPGGPRPGFQQGGFQYQQPFNNPLFPQLLWPSNMPFPNFPPLPKPGNGVFQSVSSTSGGGQQTSLVSTSTNGEGVTLVTTNGQSYLLTNGAKEPILINNDNIKKLPLDDFTEPKIKNNFEPFDPFKNFEPFQTFHDFSIPTMEPFKFDIPTIKPFNFDIPTMKPFKVDIPTINPETFKNYVPEKGKHFHSTGFISSSFTRNDNGEITGGGKYETYENKDGKIRVESKSFGDKPSKNDNKEQ